MKDPIDILLMANADGEVGYAVPRGDEPVENDRVVIAAAQEWKWLAYKTEYWHNQYQDNRQLRIIYELTDRGWHIVNKLRVGSMAEHG